VPEEIVVDVSGLGIGDVLHVANVDIPANVTLLTETDRAVATVLAPRTMEEAAAPAEGEAVEGEGAEGETGEEPAKKEKETKE